MPPDDEIRVAFSELGQRYIFDDLMAILSGGDRIVVHDDDCYGDEECRSCPRPEDCLEVLGFRDDREVPPIEDYDIREE